METEKTAFENLLESFTNLLSSDDSSLDQLQEIVDFIKENRQKIENLSVEQINGLQEALDLKVNIADIIDDLTSTLADAPLSANQGRILNEEIALLQEAIESLRVILTSDDTTLDELQEIVNFIKQNRDNLANLDLSNIAETDTIKHFTKVLKDKLDSIEEGANKYIHPASHAATMIEEDTAHRFVTDTQIDTWNNKADIDTNTWRPVSDSVSSTSSSVSASSRAVKTAYDKAASAYNKANNSMTLVLKGPVSQINNFYATYKGHVYLVVAGFHVVVLDLTQKLPSGGGLGFGIEFQSGDVSSTLISYYKNYDVLTSTKPIYAMYKI